MSYKSGLSTAAHDAMNVDDYFKLVYEKAERLRDGLIVDVFAGGGRDIKNLYDRLQEQGRFVAVDADPMRISDMLGKERFVRVTNSDELKAAFQNASIAVVQGTFPDTPYDGLENQLNGQADFVLCNAGIMFIRPEELEETLKSMAGLMAEGGEMVLRFSQDRTDQDSNKDKTYFIHSPELVHDILKAQGLSVARLPDLPDIAGRDFKWVDIHARR